MVALYNAEKPVKSMVSDTQAKLNRVTQENIKLNDKIHSLELKLANIGTAFPTGNINSASSHNMRGVDKQKNDTVMKTLSDLKKRADHDLENLLRDLNLRR